MSNYFGHLLLVPNDGDEGLCLICSLQVHLRYTIVEEGSAGALVGDVISDANLTADPLGRTRFRYCRQYTPQLGWLGSRVVSVLDSGAENPGSNRSRDAVLGKLFTPIVPLFIRQRNW